MSNYKATNIKFVTYDIKDIPHRRGEARRLFKKARRKARHSLKANLLREEA